MGCDGGTIPRRDELVKTKKKPEAKDKDSELSFQWRHCALTQLPLQKPIVMCGLGKLYNKLPLIEALLNKTPMPNEATHIKNLKDIKELNLTPNPSYKEHNAKQTDTNVGSAPFICPVVGLEMSGKYRFVALWPCGCVFSERTLKEIDSNVCIKCQGPFVSDDVVVLNGTEEDLVIMRERMGKRQLKLKKKKEKPIKNELPDATVTTEGIVKEEIKEETVQEEKKPILIQTQGTSSQNKRPGKLQKSAIDTKKIKQDYSVAKDPQASDVYKSLFTSHQSEKNQDRAHWVTYNPFYN